MFRKSAIIELAPATRDRDRTLLPFSVPTSPSVAGSHTLALPRCAPCSRVMDVCWGRRVGWGGEREGGVRGWGGAAWGGERDGGWRR